MRIAIIIIILHAVSCMKVYGEEIENSRANCRIGNPLKIDTHMHDRVLTRILTLGVKLLTWVTKIVPQGPV